MTKRFLEQSIDFMGFLGAKLRDLKGYYALTNELLQNADDAPDVTTVTFDISEMALFVENNGSFREKDFERMRSIAAGAKSAELNTIGVFGIGFLSAYQITDNPIIVSAGRKWTFHPDAEENQRIIEIDCKDYGKTYFGFPWARNPNSSVRTALKLEHITEKSIELLTNDIITALPGSVLFLRKVEQIYVKNNGKVIKSITRHPVENQRLVVSVDDKQNVWFRLNTNFSKVAAELRRQYTSYIEDKREPEVHIVIPQNFYNFQGKFYAFLPTNHNTSLPFHINADFFTSSDRKRVVFENDYQALWNEAAIIAAAHAIVDNLGGIAQFLGYKEFWEFIYRIHDAYIKASEGHNVAIIKKVWEVLQVRLALENIVYTSDGEWVQPRQAYLLKDEKEYELIDIFEQIGLKIVHPDLRDKYKLFKNSSINIATLDPKDLARALKKTGFNKAIEMESAPNWIKNAKNREMLANEIDRLLERELPANQKLMIEELQSCSIALSYLNTFNTPKGLWIGTKEDIEIFGALDLANVFASADNPAGIMKLVNPFDLNAAIDVLNLGAYDLFSISDENKLESIWQKTPRSIVNLIEWLDHRRSILKSDNSLIKRVRKLHIWPSGQKLYPLDRLFMPGNFEDPLNLSFIIDKSAINHYRDLLTDLKVVELNIVNYIKSFVPRVLQDGKKLPDEQRRDLVAFLARNLGEFFDDYEIKYIYRNFAIIECDDGEFRRASEVYFFDYNLFNILKNNVYFISQTVGKKKALLELYKWLGISSNPKPSDILSKVYEVIKFPPVGENRLTVQQIFAYIGSIWKDLDEAVRQEYQLLKTEKWLPVENDNEKWYAPKEIFTTFNNYLFKSQVKFLDADKQKLYGAFIRFLEIPSKPSCSQVVKHLLHSIESNEPVNVLLYRYLNHYLNDPALEELLGKPFIYIEKKGFLYADQVFLGKHGFGKYRIQLDTKWYNYTSLLTLLGVRDESLPRDCVNVIKEISDKFTATNKSLDNESLNVLMNCYALLNEGPYEDLLELKNLPVVPNRESRLTLPATVYFDDRPGLAQKFRKIADNFIPVQENIWKALKTTGVQLLSEAIKFHILEKQNAVPDTKMAEIIKDRKDLIYRVFFTVEQDNNEFWNIRFLGNLKIYKTTSLVIEYALQSGDNLLKSESDSTLAFLDQDNNILYYQTVNNIIPWPAIAREIAFKIDPYIRTGQLSPGIKEVLAADSREEAEFILDQLGFAPLGALNEQYNTKVAIRGNFETAGVIK